MKRKNVLLILALALTLSGCAGIDAESNKPGFKFFSNSETETTAEPTETTVSVKTWDSDTYLGNYEDPEIGKNIEYYMYIPQNATENMPLIVYLHGIGAVGASQHNENNPMIEKTDILYGDEFPFLILAPCSMSNESWSANRLAERVKNLVDYIADQYNCDRNKIILIGHSMGADGVFRQIEMYGDFYSAAIPISVSDTDIIELDRCLSVPIWGFAGSYEAPYNYNIKEMIEKIVTMGGTAKYTELEGITHGQTARYAILWDVIQWALAQ